MAIVQQLERDIARVLASPVMSDWIVEHDGEPLQMTRAEFDRFVRDESQAALQLIPAVSD